MILDNNMKGFLFVMDNAGAYKNQSVRGIIESTGN
eukprot:CAMPEP_0175049268 /NCGR_PEP_ID=MMETSP0052_2-20121109/6642_1 /TAXON_ID=51329 ORGANISM="Polytomella parva, Strain SAG 63-3" /NCGR_SAMPLE_ID=MMETSP0052_2 /ASSEMBLY_ACC=CAM_ASM_000194 /LENGTH=34 /DNA_ID= /DNA_START= /DNA_END= /DNA_ORIENTATION=